MAGPFTRIEYMAALRLRRFLRTCVWPWNEWDDIELFDILSGWRDDLLAIKEDEVTL